MPDVMKPTAKGKAKPSSAGGGVSRIGGSMLPVVTKGSSMLPVVSKRHFDDVESEEPEEPEFDEAPQDEEPAFDEEQPKGPSLAYAEDFEEGEEAYGDVAVADDELPIPEPEPTPAYKRAPPKAQPAAKKRKLNEESQGRRAIVDQFLRQWGLNSDHAARYVLDAADVSELEGLQKQHWRPNPGERNQKGESKTAAVQIDFALIKVRERSIVDKGALDAIRIFTHRWGLGRAEDEMLRALSHKDLRYVINEYDGTRHLADLSEEAVAHEPETAIALPEESGIFMVSRVNRLELIDPSADALVVGDANLSFCKILVDHRNALHHQGKTLCTTFEKLDTLRERYQEIDETIADITEAGGEVIHDVDCTRLGVDSRFAGMHESFGSVYYNFPHAGVCQGFQDGHPFVRWRHENLMHLFFRALRGFVKTGGAVKVCSSCNATGVRFSDILSAAATNEFVHVETVPFNEWQLKDYLRSYGDRRDKGRRILEGAAGYASQQGNKDMVYSFCYQPSGETPPKPRIRYPPSKQDLFHSFEGKIGQRSGAAKEALVEEVYQLFLSYVKGIHIG